MSLVAALVTVALMVSPHGERTLLFGTTQTWVFTDGDGKPLESVSTFGGLEPIEAAVSRDGRGVAFTAWSDEAHNKLLYRWTRGEAAARRIGRPSGYHAQPRFSADGGWVVFGHNPNKGGPPGRHEVGSNAQLYRVRPDGSRMEMLTATPGCKRAPASADGFLFYFVHASCDLENAIAEIRAGGTERLLTTYDAAYEELDLSPDGTRLVVTCAARQLMSV